MNELNDQITSAIGAHGMWKNRLRAAIEAGTADLTVNVVRDDHQCTFGKWLHGANLSSEIKNSHHFRKCAEFHRRFHIVASEILSLAISGKKEEASEKMKPGQEFCRVSTELTNAMLGWKASTSQLSPAAR
jgi:Chemoreceptor zinc-binding domain